jgi:hypothetical protein
VTLGKSAMKSLTSFGEALLIERAHAHAVMVAERGDPAAGLLKTGTVVEPKKCDTRRRNPAIFSDAIAPDVTVLSC